jgi:hypothetical protein
MASPSGTNRARLRTKVITTASSAGRKWCQAGLDGFGQSSDRTCPLGPEFRLAT